MKNRILACIAATGLVAASSSAFAANYDTQASRFYVAPMMSFSFPNDNAHTMPSNSGPGKFISQSSNGWQLSVGKNLGDYFAAELYAFTFNDRNVSDYNNVNLDVSGYGFNTLFFPARDILPIYALVGGGVANYDFDGISNPSGLTYGDYDEALFADFGVGLMVPLNDYGLAIRAEYRYRSTTVELSNDAYEHFRGDVVNVGLQIPLGAPAAAPEPEPAPTPEPEGPSDHDGDGVIDAYDECPGTPRSVEVNASGCPVEKKAPVVLRGVTFEFDSAKLTMQAESRLNNVIAALNASPDVEFRIEGYTDAIGTEAYNQDLSERRANSVRDYLVNHGIAPSRIEDVVGYGESNPVATNETEAGRAQNRRVELDVVQQ